MSTRDKASAYVGIRQHTSMSKRQHTSMSTRDMSRVPERYVRQQQSQERSGISTAESVPLTFVDEGRIH